MSFVPFISVIIPTFNRVFLIEETINSVLVQTYPNFELLVVDDFSEDNTKEVVNSYQDPRVKYLINKRTKGAQGARNTGLFTAKGEWIAMLDSDDKWFEDKLKEQLDYLNHKPNRIVGLGCDYTQSSSEDLKIAPSSHNDKESYIYSTEDLLYKNFIGGFSVFIFHRETALLFGGFDENLVAMQDVDFYVSLSTYGEIHKMHKVLVHQGVANNDRISNDFQKKKESSIKFKNKHLNKIKKSNKLLNIHNTRIVLFSLLTCDKRFIRYFHWIFLGIFIDFDNWVWFIRRLLSNLQSCFQKWQYTI